MQDRLMSETTAHIDESADLLRVQREREQDLAERFSRLTRPVGESPHEPPRRKRKH